MLETDSQMLLVRRDDLSHGKLFPDLFLAAVERRHVDISDSIVVGNRVWDLLASRPCSGRRACSVRGYGEDELDRAGAYRVCAHPGELSRHIDGLGVEAEV